MPDSQFDVAVYGAGPVGAFLALALQDSGLSVALLARAPSGDAPRAAHPAIRPAIRPIALSHSSRLILERAGVWNRLATTPIQTIHVSEAGAFGRTKISSADVALPALGYVAAFDEIAPAIVAGIESRNVRVSPLPAESAAQPRANLVVHAEGAPSGAPEKDYAQSAIVTLVETDRTVRGVAWERFTEQGPLALLPFGRNYAVVWSRNDASCAALLDAGDAPFLEALQSAFGMRAGRFLAVGRREATPLVLRYRNPRAATGEIYVGNAAQTLHPVAGQGLNLGLRDAWDLACLLRKAPRSEIGTARFAEEFSRIRRLDANLSIRATDLMATFFLRRDPLSVVMRGAALTAFDICPPARRSLAKRMIYGASAW